MATPTADEILELYDELNFPSAPKLRAALLKKGYRARLKDVEAFVKAQTPTQLFAKGRTTAATSSSAPGWSAARYREEMKISSKLLFVITSQRFS